MAYNINDFNTLRQEILDKIVAEETTIQEAHFEQVSQFDGSPAAIIGVSNNEALYNSQCVDRMTLVFQVVIYIPIPETGATLQVETDMGQAYWEMLNMFNQRDVLTNADIVEPLPSIWDYEERGDGIYRTSEIFVRCVKFLSNK